MKYPQEIIAKLGGPAAFAVAASQHPQAPRVLTRDAVYMWHQRNAVPFMWRPIVSDMGRLIGGSPAGDEVHVEGRK